MDSVEFLQISLFGKNQDLPIQLLDSLMILWDFDRVVGLQNGELFTLPETLRVGLARHCLFQSHHFSRSGFFVIREMGDWRGRVGGLSESGWVIEWRILLVKWINVVYTVLMCFSLERTTVVKLSLFLEGCNGSAISLGGLDSIFGWFFMPR